MIAPTQCIITGCQARQSIAMSFTPVFTNSHQTDQDVAIVSRARWTMNSFLA